MRETHVEKASDVVSLEEEVTVWVKSVDLRKNRISLTVLPPPSRTVRDLQQGMVLEGTVVDFLEDDKGVAIGAFVDVDADSSGLLHISEISDEYLDSVKEVLHLKQQVRVRVKSVDRAKGRFGLAMKDVQGGHDGDLSRL